MGRPNPWNRPIPFTPAMAVIVKCLGVFVVAGIALLIAWFPILGLARGWFVPMSRSLGLGSAGLFLVDVYNAVLLAAVAVIIRTRPIGSRIVYLSPASGAFFVTQALAMDPMRVAHSDDYRTMFWTRLVFGSVCPVVFLACTIAGMAAHRRAATLPGPSARSAS